MHTLFSVICILVIILRRLNNTKSCSFEFMYNNIIQCHKFKLQNLVLFNLHSNIEVHSSVAHSAVKVMSAASKMPFKYMKWLETPEVDSISWVWTIITHDHYYTSIKTCTMMKPHFKGSTTRYSTNHMYSRSLIHPIGCMPSCVVKYGRKHTLINVRLVCGVYVQVT